MLYVTTRNRRDAYTAQRALRENRGPDGGMYLPFRAPSYPAEDWKELAAQPFGQRVAEIMNRLFGTRLTCWDVDVCIGRSPVEIVPLGHRTLVAELWHNVGRSYDHMARELAEQLLNEPNYQRGWLEIALRIAVLFGICGQLPTDEPADISVISGDFTAPISAYYARSWGLPIGNIICCCNENSGLWELLHHGQLRTDLTSIRTVLPEADVALPENLERLVFEAGGTAEVERYLEACRRGGTYAPSDAVLTNMNRGLRVSVVSSQRISQTISSVYRTHHYVLSPGTALAYAGLMDARARPGLSKNALILAEKSPALDAKFTADSLKISEQELNDFLF
ncbi:MAG: hypothetical protein Q4F81_10580 [Eubacteriales bacterium]|nr:hypothetical protein [Eubacteriales bacterium]